MQLEFQLGWEQLIDGFVPNELALDQLPKRIDAAGRHYALSYKPILDRDQLGGVLIVVSDISAELKLQKRQAEQREILGVVERLMRDRAGFGEFFSECTALVDSLGDGSAPLPTLLRTLHTIKGNCGSYGVRSLAEIAHALETRFGDEGVAPSAETLRPLADAWRSFQERVRPLLGSDERWIELAAPELEELIAAAHQLAPRSHLGERLERLRHQRVGVRLERVADQARELAHRLGKAPLEVELSVDSELRLPGDVWAPFWSTFIHLIRNAIDHGIEPVEERLERGKPAHGKLLISAALDAERLQLLVQDDGRGIHWERVRDKARSAGLAHQTPAELVEALFSDGVSTAECVTDTSGRGVGMAAVREAARSLGGSVQVESSAGAGTSVRFEFPLAALRAEQGPAASGTRPSHRPPAHSGRSATS